MAAELLEIPCLRVGQMLQRLQHADDYPLATKRDPTETRPVSQMLVGRFARDAGEFPDGALRQPQIDEKALVMRLPVLLGQMQQPLRQSGRNRQEGRILDHLAEPAQPPARQLQQVQGQVVLNAQQLHEFAAPEHDQLDGIDRRRIGGPGQPVDQRDLAENIAGAHDVEKSIATVGGIGMDAQPPRQNAVQRIARIALTEQDLPGVEVAPHPELQDLIQDVSFQAFEETRCFDHCVDFELEIRKAAAR
jgi:hypothetical protein